MYAVIRTNGATEILINIPKNGADKTLPALANMFEHNAVFVRSGWRELDLVKPEMTIHLGDTYTIKDAEKPELVISTDHTQIVGEDFEIASPEVFVNMKKLQEKLNKEITNLRQELSFTQAKLQEALEALEQKE